MGSLPVSIISSGSFGSTFPSHVECSPTDSPPIAKKKVCRLLGSGPSGMQTPCRTASPSQFTFESADGNDSVSGAHVLSGPGCAASLTNKSAPFPKTSLTRLTQKPAGILIHRTGRSRKSNQWRRVSFSPNITVYRMDENGPICTECQALNTEVRDKQAFMARWMTRVHHQRLHLSEELSNNEDNSSSQSQTPPKFTPRVPPSSPEPRVSNWVIPEHRDAMLKSHPEVNFSFVENPTEGIKLKFVLPLGREYMPNDIVVKANMSGNRIRVIANKVRQSGGCQVIEQFNERYQTPMQVDAHQVSARLDLKGNLTVEAPLLTIDRRHTLHVGPDGRQL